MSRRYYSSVAVPTTLASSITDSGTTLVLVASTGFPSSYPFTLILDEDTAYEEVVTVTAALGSNQFTITRGSDGTTAQAHSGGAAARHGFSSRDLDEPNAHIDASTGVHGVVGSVVGTTDAQALTNKTLTAPTITTPTLTLKQSAAPTPTAEGDIQWDTDGNQIKIGDGSGAKTFSDDSITTAAIAVAAATGASDLSTHASDTSTHGVGVVVGTTETQVLSGKSIDGDDNTLSDIPISAVKNAAWTTFTPTFSSGIGTAIGNGTLTGRYQRVGRTIHFKIWFNPGTTTVFGTGGIIITGLPFNLDDSGNEREIFTGYYHDASTGTWYELAGLTNSATQIGLMYKKVNIGDELTLLALTSSAPETMAYGDFIALSGTFQATS